LADDEQPVVVAITSDQHINSTVGLCPPAVTLDDGGTYRASKAQRVVWSAWIEFWNDIVFPAADEHGAKLYAVFNGDLCDKNVHSGAQLISRDDADVVRMTVDVLTHERANVMERADAVFVVRGTEAHTGEKAALEELIAADVGAEPDKQAGTASWYWLKLEAGGVLFDIAHHPCTSSRRAHTRSGAAERQAAETVMQYVRRNERPPQVVVRSHVHGFAKGGELALGVFTPPWMMAGAFGHRIGKSGAIEPVGGVMFVCRGGRYEWDDRGHLWWPRRKRAWTGS
jgi:hypothetical protein